MARVADATDEDEYGDGLSFLVLLRKKERLPLLGFADAEIAIGGGGECGGDGDSGGDGDGSTGDGPPHLTLAFCIKI